MQARHYDDGELRRRQPVKGGRNFREDRERLTGVDSSPCLEEEENGRGHPRVLDGDGSQVVRVIVDEAGGG